MHCITELQALCALSISNFQKASQRAPLNLKMHSKKCLRDSKMGARSAWGDTNYSQEAQVGPKMPPRAPKWRPRGAQDTVITRYWRPRGAKLDPGGAQERPCRGQKVPKSTPRAPKIQSQSTFSWKKHTLLKH